MERRYRLYNTDAPLNLEKMSEAFRQAVGLRRALKRLTDSGFSVYNLNDVGKVNDVFARFPKADMSLLRRGSKAEKTRRDPFEKGILKTVVPRSEGEETET